MSERQTKFSSTGRKEKERKEKGNLVFLFWGVFRILCVFSIIISSYFSSPSITTSLPEEKKKRVYNITFKRLLLSVHFFVIIIFIFSLTFPTTFFFGSFSFPNRNKKAPTPDTCHCLAPATNYRAVAI